MRLADPCGVGAMSKAPVENPGGPASQWEAQRSPQPFPSVTGLTGETCNLELYLKHTVFTSQVLSSRPAGPSAWPQLRGEGLAAGGSVWATAAGSGAPLRLGFFQKTLFLSDVVSL